MDEVLLAINFVVLWAVVMLNLLLTFALIRRINKTSQKETQRVSESNLKVGEPAPDFTAVNLDGEPVTLGTYAGRRTAFIFVSPTCGPCREALPKYEAAAPQARKAGVDLVLFSTANGERTRAFVDELDIQLPSIATPDGANILNDAFGFRGTPSFCLVDAEGRVEHSGYPSFEWGAWKRLVQSWEEARLQIPELSASTASSSTAVPVAERR